MPEISNLLGWLILGGISGWIGSKNSIVIVSQSIP